MEQVEGIQRPAEIYGASAVATAERAEAYLGITRDQLRDAWKAGGLKVVEPPRVRVPALFRYTDLDQFAYEHLTVVWRPAVRRGRSVVLYTGQAARYLGLTEQQLGRLVRANQVPAIEGGGAGAPYAFRVRDLDECLSRWLRATLPPPQF